MSHVKTLKNAILLCGHSNVTPFLWGHRGLGKSSIVAQLADENAMGFIDMRCAQMEASDLRGLPDKVNGRTVYCPPAEMPIGDLTDEQYIAELLLSFTDLNLGDGAPEDKHSNLLTLTDSDIQINRRYRAAVTALQPRRERGILFLDELNRASDDTQTAAFQLVLDRKVGMYTLPPGWFVVVAGNYNEGYQVSGFTDPAFLNRFSHLQFYGGEQSMEDWLLWMADKHGANAAQVIEYTSQNVQYMDGSVEGNLGFSPQPSRRSWDAVVRVVKAYDSLSMTNSEAKHIVISGLVGRDCAIGFERATCPIKPFEILRDGVKAHSSKIRTLSRDQLLGLMWGVVASAKPQVNGDNADIRVIDICLDFADEMLKIKTDRDLVVAFCRAMAATGSDTDKIRAAMISNQKLAALVAKVKGKSEQENFIDRLTKRTQLHELVSSVAWGNS